MSCEGAEPWTRVCRTAGLQGRHKAERARAVGCVPLLPAPLSPRLAKACASAASPRVAVPHYRRRGTGPRRCQQHTWRLTKQLMPCATIFSHFSRIFSFSAASMSATCVPGEARTAGSGQGAAPRGHAQGGAGGRTVAFTPHACLRQITAHLSHAVHTHAGAVDLDLIGVHGCSARQGHTAEKRDQRLQGPMPWRPLCFWRAWY